MATLSSESDSSRRGDTRHLSYYFFSLTTDLNHVSQNPEVPEAQRKTVSDPGVRVHFFLLLAVCQLPFVSSQWLI
jgi:hypothetical protein